MKPLIALLMIIGAGSAGWLLRAVLFKSANPATEAAHRNFREHSGKIISAAESMPANKYGYAPPYSDNYFLEIVQQVGSDTLDKCDQLVKVHLPHFKLPPAHGRPSPDAFPEEFKNKAIEQLKNSMDLCDRTFLLLNDSQFNEVVTAQGEPELRKADVIMNLIGDLASVENEMDTYLKLSATASAANVR